MLLKRWTFLLTLASAMFYSVATTEAVDVLNDVQLNFQHMRDEAADVQSYHAAEKDLQTAMQDLEAAKNDLQEAKQYKETAETDLAAAQKAVAEAQKQLAISIQNVQKARAEAAAKTNTAIDRQQAVVDFLPKVENAQNELTKLQKQFDDIEAEAQASTVQSNRGPGLSDEKRAAQIAAALERINYAEEYLGQVEQEFGEGDSSAAGSEGTDAENTEYQGKVDAMRNDVDAAQDKVSNFNDQLTGLQDGQTDAEEAEKDAREALADAQKDQHNDEADLKNARVDFQVAIADENEVLVNLKTAEGTEKAAEKNCKAAIDALKYFGESRSWQTGMEFYSWNGSSHGHQFYWPIEFDSTDRHKNLDISLSTGYVSSNTGLENGHVSGWTDTTVGISRLNAHKKYDVQYNLNINIPTGQSKIYNNAVVPDDLSRFTRFGEGWNWTPGITTIKHITDADSMTLESSYSLRGNYEYTKDIPGASINPGNLWSETLTYLHVEKNKKFMGRLFFTDTGETRENGLKYTEGKQIGLAAYYEKAVSNQNNLEVYSGVSFTGATDYQGGTTEPNNDVHRQYFGMGISHVFSPSRTLSIMGNYMRSDGYSYDPLRNTYSDNRHRVSLLVGYEEKLDTQDKLSAYLERYFIENDTSEDYNGWGIKLLWTRSF